MWRRCSIEIEMSDKNGSWLPYSLTTGKIHDCLGETRIDSM